MMAENIKQTIGDGEIISEPVQSKKKVKIVQTLGTRKRAVARAIARPGSGIIMINGRPLAIIQPEMARLKMQEPVIVAGEAAKSVDIEVNVTGGGPIGQADAARTAIANVLVGFDRKLKPIFIAYDRTLLVSDPRRTEPHKPSRSKTGPRRHKQRSKR